LELGQPAPKHRKDITMKRRKVTSRPLSLGDLILAVSSYSETQEETVATVADLLASGQVSIMNNGRKIRARVR
jgi:S-adenosylmethionine:tRNA-ribosyltransferase-isomerase (queuine synthetase)